MRERGEGQQQATNRTRERKRREERKKRGKEEERKMRARVIYHGSDLRSNITRHSLTHFLFYLFSLSLSLFLMSFRLPCHKDHCLCS